MDFSGTGRGTVTRPRGKEPRLGGGGGEPDATSRTGASRANSRNGGGASRRGFRIEARRLGQQVGGGRAILRDVSITVEAGQLVALIGPSGAGKTTLLDALAGIRPAARGTVRYDGVDYYANPEAFRSSLGYVPQDDIIHRELPLARILRYAAWLRLPAGSPPTAADEAVAEVLATLDMAGQAATPVGRLSGGQRKRASIAVELLPRPRAFFLDEPTSGLDPAMAAEFVGQLRTIADTGATVVFTTHNPADVSPCDQVVVLAPGGNLAFAGPPAESCRFFRAAGIDEIYQKLAEDATGQTWSQRFRDIRPAEGAEEPDGRRSSPPASVPAAGHSEAHPVGPVRQWVLLTRRNLDIVASSRLTLAILAGSPALVVWMIVVLFRPGAFDLTDPSPNAAVMILFWVAFGSFFFGITYGLLQICPEFAILCRERFVGLRLGPYLLAKLTVLLPALALADAVMLAALRATNRLQAADWATYGSLFTTLLLSSAAALALGLLASAAVSTPEQATMVLPMLGFPHALFSGAIFPVPMMAAIGKAISYPLSTRWAFEGLGRTVEINQLFTEGNSPLGLPLRASYGDTFTRPVPADWVILTAFTLVFLGSAWVLLARKSRGYRRPASVGRHRQDLPRRDREPAASVPMTSERVAASPPRTAHTGGTAARPVPVRSSPVAPPTPPASSRPHPAPPSVRVGSA
jgi:ABC-type multidrug transport system ATPase subunit